ncbi:hypothetical protein EXIGLDRAFT_725556 [Exidia glandulosa HHB12029]|uniref:Condensation domain-containing protein n=1 Tax=Exidia glandulosa HHB12029 TaxID=1314781 RepID=A0A165DYV0_EXIGL|nr:hypothetical protein EXIGLDRAFT_725556 [Exidia glandulosa HHB12029]
MTMVEPPWTSPQDGVYSRPLLGSEALADSVSVMADGCMEVCHGLAFTTTLAEENIPGRVFDAMLRLRFESPLVAGMLVADEKSPNRRWVYRAAKDYNEAIAWCQRALIIHQHAGPAEDFIAIANGMRLPYEVDHYTLFFTCHLLLCDSGTHWLFFHGTHAIMDAIPTLEALAQMLGWISVPEASYLFPVSRLAWGSEWTNLPEGPVTSTGGPQEGCESEVPRLLRRMEEVASNSTPTVSLRPQRTEIREQGRSIRFHRSIDRFQTSELIRETKALGLSVTVLFEAAQVLATLARSEIGPEDMTTAHVTLDASIIALKRRFVSPHKDKPHFVSAMTMVPLDIPYNAVSEMDSKTQLIAVMKMLQAQYAEWNSSPHLPWLGSQYFRTTPHAGLITNIGVVENIVPRLWPDQNQAVIEVHKMAFGHRNAQSTRPITHLWTMNSTLHLQIQVSDMWDDEYIQAYMDDIISNALLLLSS